MNMNKRNIYWVLMVALLAVACDRLPDELFTKKVIFTKNGFTDFPLSLTESGDTVVNLSVSVSGTSSNSANVRVSWFIDSLKLANYNFDKYRNLTSAYYKLLPNDCYEILNSEIAIESGKEYALLPVKINFGRINKFERYVLPISLKDPSEYVIDEDHSGVLLYIMLSNSFSGNYSLINSSLFDGEKGSASALAMTGAKKTLFAIDYNTCYFYAGNKTELSADYDKYFVEVSLQSDSTMTYRADNADLQLSFPAGQENNYIVAKMPKQGSKKNTVTTQLNMEYSYFDASSGVPVKRTFVGSLVNQRDEESGE